MPKDHCNAGNFGLFLSSWNVTQNIATPDIHFRMANWLQACWERGDRRLLLQAFRASGKSSIAGMFIAWALLRDPDLRFLVLSAELSLAEKMVRSVRTLIERHPLTGHLKPNKPDQWASDSLTIKRNKVSRDPSVLARGIFSNITGIRADIILCDDVEVPNTCDTADKRERLRERLSENEFILTPGGLQLYIGTPHSYYSIYAKEAREEIGETENFLKGYERLTIPITGKDGKSAWPDRYPVCEIERLRLRAGPLKFAAQMMLEEVNVAKSYLDPRLFNRYRSDLDYREVQGETHLSLDGKRMMSVSAWWDPAFGERDGSVLAVVYTADDGTCYLHRMEYITVKPKDGEDEARVQCRRVAEVARDLYVSSVTVETNGLGKFLPAVLRQEMAAMKVPCAVSEKSNSKPKDIRILEEFDARMAARSMYIHASVYDTPFIREVQEWRPELKNARDDGLDAAAGALSLEPVRLRRNYSGLMRSWRGIGKAQTAMTEFEV